MYIIHPHVDMCVAITIENIQATIGDADILGCNTEVIFLVGELPQC